MKRKAFFCAVLVAVTTCSITRGGPVADYGDAPDGALGKNYPSKFGTPNAAPGQNAPFHFDVTREWLGFNGPLTTTTVEADSLQVDADFDDATSSIFMLNAAGIGQRGYLYTTASYNPALSTASETRYLNAAVDFNNNGVWGDVTATQREWVVRNVPFDFSGLPAGVTNTNIFVGFHLDPAFVGATNRWTRVTLSTQPVTPTGEWNGSGPSIGFSRGETEDFLNATVATSTLDANGVGGGAGFGLKNIQPVGVKFTPDVTPDGFHALTPAPPPRVHVADVTFNVPADAVDPLNAFGGEAALMWTRDCDIGAGACLHLPFLGPNPADAVLGGIAGNLALPPVGGGGGVGFTTGLVKGKNTIPVLAAFPDPTKNGDTHSTLKVWVDPQSTFYLNLQNDDSGLYGSGSSYDTDNSHPDFIYPVGVPEPSGLMLGLGAVIVTLPLRLRRAT